MKESDLVGLMSCPKGGGLYYLHKGLMLVEGPV